MELKHRPIWKIIKEAGPIRVSYDGTEFLKAALEEYAENIATLAWRNARHAKRVTVQRNDVELALSQFDKMK